MKSLAGRGLYEIVAEQDPAPGDRAIPDERDFEIALAIREARKRWLGEAYRETKWPPGAFDGCRTIGERIRRARFLKREMDLAKGSVQP